MIRFGVLGPAAAWRDGRPLELGTPQQRTLFAVLLLQRNEIVTTDRMVELLWPSAAPANAVEVVRTYVSRLRSGGLAASMLITRRHGYELRAEAGAVDAERLESLAAEARDELDAGRADRAEGLLTEALGLVRGPPLPELADDEHARAERDRLQELCAAAAEDLVDVRLAQGRHRELVAELRVAVAAEPLRERAWGQLMVALYRSGRQAEALAAYRDARRALVDLLGLEPGSQLRALERMILLQDASLDLRRRGGFHGTAPASSAVMPSWRRSWPTSGRGGWSRSPARRAPARHALPPRWPPAREPRSGGACGGLTSTRSGLAGSSRPSPAHSTSRRCPAARRSTSRSRAWARRRRFSCWTTAST